MDRNPESKPTTAEANKLARDIESLFRDCESVVQMALDRDTTRPVMRSTLDRMEKVRNCTTASILLTPEFSVRAICVCNADGSVSEEEASLYCEIFNYLTPQQQSDLPRNLQEVRKRYPSCRKAMLAEPTPVAWIYLQEADQLNGTAFASRYRELLLRMANMFASAEGVRSERKLSCVAEIERALSPATISPQQWDAGKSGPTVSGLPAKATMAAPTTKAIQTSRGLQEILLELDGLIGLNTVKGDVRQLANHVKVLQIRQAKGLKVSDTSLHTVF